MEYQTDGSDKEAPGDAPADSEQTAQAGADAASSAEGGDGAEDGVEGLVREALRGVTDPELGINIVDLGLVYDVHVVDSECEVTMTLTSPGCPAGGQIMEGAKGAAESVDGVEAATVTLVWKPFWTPEKIDPKVRAALGF